MINLKRNSTERIKQSFTRYIVFGFLCLQENVILLFQMVDDA